MGNHAITVVGYGVLDNKIYWLIQNSWDSNWCDNGFIKMEIGQFIEVSFSQPLISNSTITPDLFIHFFHNLIYNYEF